MNWKIFRWKTRSCCFTCYRNFVLLRSVAAEVKTDSVYSPNSTWLDSTRLDSTRSTCRAHAFRLCRHCRTAQLDWLDTTRATRNLVCCVISIKLWLGAAAGIERLGGPSMGRNEARHRRRRRKGGVRGGRIPAPQWRKDLGRGVPPPLKKIALLTLKWRHFSVFWPDFWSLNWYCDAVYSPLPTALYTPPQSHRIYANLTGRPGGGWGRGVRTPGSPWTPPRLVMITVIHVLFNVSHSLIY